MSHPRNLQPDDPRIAAWERAKERAGGYMPIIKALRGKVTHTAVRNWIIVPPMRVLDIERLSGVSRYELRPDVYGDPLKEIVADMDSVKLISRNISEVTDLLDQSAIQIAQLRRLISETVPIIEQYVDRHHRYDDRHIRHEAREAAQEAAE